VVAERAITTIELPNEEIKGRIIGRNGRNVQAFEQAAGVDIIVDDTPEAVTISCFDPVRREVARRARALGMDVMAHDPFVKDGDPAWALARPHGLEPLLREADVVSLHVPLTDGTRHLIDDLRLRRMRKDAVLLNAARGGIVDQDALVEALRSGSLGGATRRLWPWR